MTKLVKIGKEIDIYPYGQGVVDEVKIKEDDDFGVINIDMTEEVTDPMRVDFEHTLEIETEDLHIEEASVSDLEDVYGSEKGWISFKVENRNV